MKKNRTAIILLLILIVITIILLVFKNRVNTLEEKFSNFAVDDTATITKVFLADKDNMTVTLTKQSPGKWMINDEFNASKDAIDMLLKTVMSIEVKEPVSKAGTPEVIRLLATNSVKVEIYQKVYRINLFGKIRLFPHEKITKTYYVGCPTQNNMGTYMLIEGAETPYITHIFGFNGFLTSRYSTQVKDWRDHAIFSLKYNQIKSVSIRISDDRANSFTATKKSPRDFEVICLNDNKAVTAYDTLKIMELFSSFEDVRFEALVNDMEQLKKDSIMASQPYIVVLLEESGGQKHQLTTYLRLAPPDAIDQEGKAVIYDRDRLYALINNNKDLAIIQFYVFDMIFKPLSYYTEGKLSLQ